jgi:hypothetical protein
MYVRLQVNFNAFLPPRSGRGKAIWRRVTGYTMLPVERFPLGLPRQGEIIQFAGDEWFTCSWVIHTPRGYYPSSIDLDFMEPDLELHDPKVTANLRVSWQWLEMHTERNESVPEYHGSQGVTSAREALQLTQRLKVLGFTLYFMRNKSPDLPAGRP